MGLVVVVVKLSLKSIQSQFNSTSTIEAELVLFPFDPATHNPPPTHSQEKFQLKLERSQTKTGISFSVSNSILFHRFSTFGWGNTLHENVFRCSYLESKTEPSVAKAQDYMGGHRTYFVEKGNNWGGDTAQH